MSEREERAGASLDAGAVGLAEAEPVRRPQAARRPRTSVLQFLREVRDELRQVAWPTRSEMVNYTTVVFVTLVLMTTLIFLLNYGFGKAVIYMFQK